jgi:hypothetical protein
MNTIHETGKWPKDFTGGRCTREIKFRTAMAKAALTLSVRAEYMYSMASCASCPDGVLVLHNFHKVVK